MKNRLYAFLALTGLLLLFLASCAGSSVASPEISPIEELKHPPLSAPLDPSPSPGFFRDLLTLTPHPKLSLGAEDPQWYRDSVFYHVWVSAFHDSNGDGVGDIKGITQKLDYLQKLGVTALWLSPFFQSASGAINLHMYDSIDQYQVDPRFGTLADVDELLEKAHSRGIRLIFDWVPNHVSHKHPWFQEKKDWFLWRQEPGSQEGPWGKAVWHEGPDKDFFYGVFHGGLPDINFRHQGAKDAITNVAVHWLNRGFDGMRVDAVKYVYEDTRSVRNGYDDQPETIEYFQALRSQVLDKLGAKKDAQGRGYHKFMVAENWTNDQESLTKFMVQDGKKAFHMTLDFPLAYALSSRNPPQILRHWEWVTQGLPSEASMGTFLSNHDNVVNRPISIHKDPLVRGPMALQLLGPGTPFLYYGNEIGMPDVSSFAGAPHADRRHRQPLDWQTAKDQETDPSSLFNLHKTLINLRARRISLRRGDFQSLDIRSRALVFTRTFEGETTLIAVNLVNRDIELELPMPPQWKDHRADTLFSTPGQDVKVEKEVLKGVLVSGGAAVWSLSPR